jgi:hypothetical protein
MGFGEAVSTCFRKYATFQGRARRSEFWYYYLFIIIVNVVLTIPLTIALNGSADGIVVNETTGEITTNGNASLSAFAIIMLIIVGVWALAILLPTLSVMVRRLHDADHSGWWWWINLVCFGWIVLLIFWVSEGTRGPNRFGPDPKA